MSGAFDDDDDSNDFRYGFGKKRTDEAASRPRHSRRRWVFIGLAGLAVVGLAAVAWFTWTPPHESAAPAPVNTAASAPDSTPAPSVAPSDPSADADPSAAPAPLPPEEAAAAVEAFITTAAVLDPASPEVSGELAGVASGAIVEEIQNDQAELQQNGWTRRGKPTVSDVTVIPGSPATPAGAVVVQACVDSTDVVTLDSDGAPLTGAGTDGVHRALNLFTMQPTGSSWQIIARSFPDDPTC